MGNLYHKKPSEKIMYNNLAEEYIEFEKTATSETTIDDFFSHCKIPKKHRTNFAFAAIMKQVRDKTTAEKLTRKKRIAFDIHGTLDCDSNGLLMTIFDMAIKMDEVFIISGPPTEQIEEELGSLGINSINITVISVVDWLKAQGTYMWQDDNDGWWCDDFDWWASKGKICAEYKIDMIFDDKVQYHKHMPKTTKFILWTGNGDGDV